MTIEQKCQIVVLGAIGAIIVGVMGSLVYYASEGVQFKRQLELCLKKDVEYRR